MPAQPRAEDRGFQRLQISSHAPVQKAVEELVQAICVDASAAAVSITHDSLSEMKHIHGISDQINENAAAIVSLLRKADEKAEALSTSNEKVLSILGDLKATIAKSTRIQALHWAITYVKASQPSEIVGNFEYYSTFFPSPRDATNSKALVLSILFTFLRDQGLIVTGFGLDSSYSSGPTNDKKAAAEAKFKQVLSEQINQLTGLKTKFTLQSDGRFAIFMSP